MVKNMRTLKLVILLATFSFASLALADVPVVDAYQSDSAQSSDTDQSSASNAAATAAATTANLPMGQRVTILERQVDSLTQLLTQINNLQQQVQDLRGQLDIEKHNLAGLQDQLRSQYQDIDQRLTQQKNKTTTVAAASTTPAAGDSDDSDASADTAAADDSSATDSTAPKVAVDQTAYQAAFNLLKAKKYSQATTAFKAFVQKYPSSSNVVNAYYFLGQLALLQGQPDKAILQFQTIIKKYPTDHKVADTKVQLGLAYYAKGDLKRAQAELSKVQKEYPGTAAAKLAQNRLQQIQHASQAVTTSASNDDSTSS